MRVLFLFPRKLDKKNSVGGVAEFLLTLLPILKTQQVESFVYAGDKSLQQISTMGEVTHGVNVFHGPFPRPSWWMSNRILQSVVDLCRKLKIDVVHAQGTYTAGFLAREIFKKTGIPYVVTSHNDISPVNSKRMRRFTVRNRCRNVLRHAAQVTHLTSVMEELSHQLFDTREKSSTIGNGINYADWQAYQSLSEKNYLLGIGRLERGKGFHVLIDAYAELIKHGVTDSLIIAGTGTEEKNLHQQVQQLKLNLVTDYQNIEKIPEKSVIFTGYIRGELKNKLIAQSKLMLFPTQPDLWEEAFSIVQLEAMVTGRAMIASDTLATRYLQTSGLQTLIVKAADVQDWIDKILLLLRDHDARMQMGNRNLLEAKKFDWNIIAKQYIDVYQRVIERT
ncbi:MAG: hypothetical protein ACD_46C00718G0002 [uncultured bacterium]|nr:MAG: hypothetical protein ACD_46C00718G0002 [uncultured bacterium]